MEKKIILKRLYETQRKEETLGILLFEGIEKSFVLEDQKQKVKVYGETRIPAGIYLVRLKTSGRIHERYSKKFPEFHKGMLEICDIPGFTNVYIHIGNDDQDTLGCPLTGRLAYIEEGVIETRQSTAAYKAFYIEVLKDAEDNNLIIEIQDEK